MKRVGSAIFVAISVLVLLTSCRLGYNYDFTRGTYELASDRLEQVLDALSSHDEAALFAMFSDDAQSNYADDLHEGIDYVFSLISEGEVSLAEDGPRFSVDYFYSSPGQDRILVKSGNRIESDGSVYWLYFNDVTHDSLDPTREGLWTLGVYSADLDYDSLEAKAFREWTYDYVADSNAPPSIYIPAN